MGAMFSGCTNLTTLDLSKFNTSKVTYMNSMFKSCKSLTIIDVSGFNTSNVTDMESMFYGCNLSVLDLSCFDTSNVTNMGWMFGAIKGLVSLNLSNFNTSKVTNIYFMFYYSSLKEIDLSNADFTNVTSYSNMFSGVNNKDLVIHGNSGLKEWFTTNIPNYANNVIVPTI